MNAQVTCPHGLTIVAIDRSALAPDGEGLAKQGLTKILTNPASSFDLVIVWIGVQDKHVVVRRNCVAAIPDAEEELRKVRLNEEKSATWYNTLLEYVMGAEISTLEERAASRAAVKAAVERAKIIRKQIYDAALPKPAPHDQRELDILKSVQRMTSEICSNSAAGCRLYIFSHMIDKRSSAALSDEIKSATDFGRTHGRYMVQSGGNGVTRQKLDVHVWGFGRTPNGQSIGAKDERKLREFWSEAFNAFLEAKLSVNESLP